MPSERDTMKTKCAFCDSMSVMEAVSGKSLKRGKDSLYLGVFTCHHCDFFMMALGVLPEIAIVRTGRPSDWLKGLEESKERGYLEWYPADVADVEYEGLPPNIARAASEAHVSLRNGQLIAAAITTRATLEAIVKAQGASGKTLEAKVDDLHASHKIHQLLKDQAHAIRHVGNEMAHGDFATFPDEEEVEHIIEFMDALIDTHYVQPARLQAAQDKRDARRQQP